MKANGIVDLRHRSRQPETSPSSRAPIGLHGVRVEHPGELDDALRAAFAHDGPAVDRRADARARSSRSRPAITAGQAKGFALWADAERPLRQRRRARSRSPPPTSASSRSSNPHHRDRRPVMAATSVASAAKTHYLPDDDVHYKWDVGNEPTLVIEPGDTVIVWTRDISDNQVRPTRTRASSRTSTGIARTRSPARSRSRAQARRHARRRGARHPYPGLGLDRGDPGLRTPARGVPRRLPAHLRPLRRRRRVLPRGHRHPARAVLRHDGRLPGGRARPEHPPARQRSAATWTSARPCAARPLYLPGPGRRRACSPAATPTRHRATARSA